MRSIPVIVDSHLRVDGNLIGHDLTNKILDELTIYNHAKDKAKKMNRWGWQKLPDDFLLANLDGDTVVMPRGYALQLKTLLREKQTPSAVGGPAQVGDAVLPSMVMA